MTRINPQSLMKPVFSYMGRIIKSKFVSVCFLVIVVFTACIYSTAIAVIYEAVPENVIIGQVFTVDSASVHPVDFTDTHGNYLKTVNAVDGFYSITLSTNMDDWWGEPFNHGDFYQDYVWFSWIPDWSPDLPPLHIFPTNYYPFQSYAASSLPSEITFWSDLMLTEPSDLFSMGGTVQAIFLDCLNPGSINVGGPFPPVIFPPACLGTQFQLDIPEVTQYASIPPYAAVPEPSTVALLGLGLPVLAILRRHRQ